MEKDQARKIWVQAILTGLVIPNNSDIPVLAAHIPLADGSRHEAGEKALRSAPVLDIHGIRGLVLVPATLGEKNFIAVDGKTIGRLREGFAKPCVDVRGACLDVFLVEKEALAACLLASPVISMSLTLGQALLREGMETKKIGELTPETLRGFMEGYLKKERKAWGRAARGAMSAFPGLCAGRD